MSGTDDAGKILITGAGGFVGRWLLARLKNNLPAGSTVIALTNEDAALDADQLVNVDIRDHSRIAQLIKEAQPTAVIHLAAISSPPFAKANQRLTWDVNFTGTMNLAQAVLQHARDARVVFVGTSESYGGSFNKTKAPANESLVLDPTHPYAASKAAADLLIGQMARDGLKAIRFRPFNHTGPGQPPSFVVPAFAAQIAAIEAGEQAPVMKVGNLDAFRDFSDVRDIVDAYARAISQALSFEPGLILNLASGQPRRIGDILAELVALAKVTIRVEPDPALLRPNEMPRAVGDASRAREVLGWKPSFEFHKTLMDVLEHFRSLNRKSG